MTRKRKKFNRVTQPSTFDFIKRFPTEESAREYLINARWPNGVICPNCGHDEVWRIREGKLFTCKGCRKQFTVRVGTVMQNSPIPLQKWLFAMYLFGIHSKGVASTKMAELLGVTQKTAWHMDHRLREAFIDGGLMFEGTIEADEVYIGGKEKNKHNSKKLRAGRGSVGKVPVLGILQRDGEMVAFPVESTDKRTLSGNLNSRVMPGSKVYTDEHKGYGGLKDGLRHETISHGAGEYVRGDVHTNTIEGVWSLVRRSHIGVYHYWSRKHLHRYIAEITQRRSIQKLPAFDSSNGSGITMVRMMMAGMVGARLTYKELINAAA